MFAEYKPYTPTMLRNMHIFGTHVLEYTELLFEQDMRCTELCVKFTN